MVRGVAWTALANWGSQALSWAAVIVLARILTASDYGIVGMAGLYLGLIAILTEGGLGTSIVALRDLSDEAIAQFNTVAVLLGLLGAALTAAAAVPLGLFFRAPDLPPVVLALSGVAVLSALRLVPVAVMQKELRFRGLAAIEGVQAVTNTVVTLTLALLGARYWALVSGALAGNAAAALASRILSPQRFRRPRLGAIGRYYAFTRDVLVGRMAWYVYSNADFAVAGRALGSAALGAYTFAWSIASVPVDKITALVTRVSTGIFARVKDDLAELSRMLHRLTEGLVMLTLPAAVGMAVVADDFVLSYLGPRWVEAILPLRILCLYATFRSVVTLLPQVLTMRGETRFLMWNAVARAVAMPVAFAVGSRWGAGGIAAMWVLVYPAFLVPMYRLMFRSLQMPLRQYLAPIWPSLRGVLVMAAVLIGVRLVLDPEGSPVARLGVQVGVGGVTYLLTGLLPQRERVRRLVALLVGRREAPA